MSNLLNKVVTGVSTIAMAASMLVMPATTHAAVAGEVYKTTDGTVWFITKDMQKRPFTSAGAFMSYGFLSFSQVKEADSSVTSLPSGAFIAPQDGRIFCATATKGTDVSGECSLVTGGQKAAFTSASVFAGQGFSFNRAYYGDSSFLSKTSNIDNSSAQHRPGTLINNNGTVQLVVSGGLWGVPSMDVFNSWGWSFADVVPSNSADVLLSQTGVIPARQAGDLVPTATTGGGNTGGPLNGGAGDAVISATTADNETTVNEGDNNTFVNGFKVEATGSDIQVSSIKVGLQHTSGSGSTVLSRYSDTVSVYEGSTKVGSMDVSDFTKSGTTYSASIPLTNAIVREGSANKQTFHVAVSALSNIDSADTGVSNNVWTVTPSQVRFMDGTGVTLTNSTWSSSTSTFTFDSLASSGDVKFKVSTASDNPVAGNVEVSDTGSTSNLTMLKFKLNAVGSDVHFDTIHIVSTSTGVTGTPQIATEYALMRGSSNLQTVTPVEGAQDIVLDTDETVSADSTATYSIVAKIAKIATTSANATAFDEGDTLKVSLGNPDSVNGKDINEGAIGETGTALGEVQTFFSQGISVTNFKSSVLASTNTAGHSIKQTYTVTYDVTAFGNTYYLPKAATRGALVNNDTNGLGFTVEKSDGTLDASTADVAATASGITSSNANTVGGYFEIPDGETKSFSVSIEIGQGSSTLAGFYHIQLGEILYDLNQTAVGTDEARLTLTPAQNFETADAKIDLP